MGLFAVAIYLLIALSSYHPDDPGWSHSVSVDTIHNSAGVVGAWLADVLLYLFGYFGYIFPIVILVSSWRLLQLRKLKQPFNSFHFSLHTIGLILGLIGGCGLAWMHFKAGGSLPHEIRGAGGILGDATGSVLSATFGYLGSTLLLLVMFLTGLTLYTDLSWLWLMDKTGHWTLQLLAYGKQLQHSIRDQIMGRQARKDRETVLKLDQEIEQLRKPPKIEPIISGLETGVRAEKEKQEFLFEPPANTVLPPLNLLDEPAVPKGQYSHDALEAMSRQVELKLKDFGITVEVVAVQPGPVITRFELQPAPGVKVSQVSNLAKDLARSLSVVSVRVVEIIPGKSVIGLEIPNEYRELVTLGEILNSREYESVKSPLVIGLGKDISGNPVVTNLSRMPHLLVAGTTGSGKSVALNAMILSLLYKATAREIRLIMIDPKMLELSVYEGIPHLLAPVVTDMKESANALRWCVAEMERRYKLMASLGVRNIGGYNHKVKVALERGQPIPDPFYQPLGEDDQIPTLEELAFIIVVVDELADMMMTVGKKVEELIARLAQKARASGIHLILATQRPSVDVITGLIKANIPCRIAFQVSAKVDSRTILDQIGAENLLGHGDMLFLPPGTGLPVRIHGAFVSDDEVHKVVENLRSHGEQDYHDEILRGPNEGGTEPIPGLETVSDDMDPLYDEAVRIVTETRKASISYIQRRLKIGYNRAARMVEEMEQSGVVGPLESNGSREVIAPPPPEV
jgi:S-DNA-T family DNA segregation ATPase FtsK/SpoIIIE